MNEAKNQGLNQNLHPTQTAVRQLRSRLAGRPIVLVGMMGAGKTSVGRRLARHLSRTFIDSDQEIEAAAGMDIQDFFDTHGEAEFRTGEAKVIARLLKQDACVLATGGGAFMSARTRTQIAQKGISVWIKAEFDLLFARISRKSTRPLLQTPDPKTTLKKLIEDRYPVYGLADVTIVSRDVPHDSVAAEIINALNFHLDQPEN